MNQNVFIPIQQLSNRNRNCVYFVADNKYDLVKYFNLKLKDITTS